ncbi:hypothetical protein [Endozoicomonas sp. ISHI1]|uniref:hypothetical protein n=1 Tax=unclassified Endozoicomonas TaxID=2644528 RepID=UPI0035A03EE9
MFDLCRLVIFLSLLSYGASYGSQDNTGYDEHESSNRTISYEDYKQSFSTNLLNLLTFLSSHYDEFRLPLRVTEIAVVCLSHFYLLKLGNTLHDEYNFIFLSGILLSGVANISYDLRINLHNYESLTLFIFKLIAQRTEHASSLLITEYLAVKLFSGLCPICLEPMRYPIAVAACKRHWYCKACIRMWEVQSPLCAVCRQ